MSMLDATQYPFEANLALSLMHDPGGVNDRATVNATVGSELNLFGTPMLAAAQAAREAGNAPNAVLAAAAAIVGPRSTETARRIVRGMIDPFARAGLKSTLDDAFEVSAVKVDPAVVQLMTGRKADAKALALIEGLEARKARSPFLRYVRALEGHLTHAAALAAAALTLAWGPLMRKRISTMTAEMLPWWLRLFGVLIGASVDASQHTAEAFCGLSNESIIRSRSLTDIAHVALFGGEPDAGGQFAFQTLLGLLLSNGPGTISAQGAKGAVSADGPETPERVQLNKAMIGFLTHAGYAHGGNGYEGITFLIEQFQNTKLVDSADPNHGLDLGALATGFATKYASYKAAKKEAGSLDIQKIPGVNHPVFKDKPVNKDPREEFVRGLLAKRGEYNVFYEFYHVLVQTLFDLGIARNVYCVNIDAVIAALLLKLCWQPYLSGRLSQSALENAAFTIFLYARMLGCAAEADDHLNRGRNMDTRTPASKSATVS
jgi:hypothetical protein